MLFWSIRFIMEWVIWLALADKTRWKEILPVCIFAGYISLIADQVCELLETSGVCSGRCFWRPGKCHRHVSGRYISFYSMAARK